MAKEKRSKKSFDLSDESIERFQQEAEDLDMNEGQLMRKILKERYNL